MADTDSLGTTAVKATYSICSIISLFILSFHAYRMKQVSQEKTSHSIINRILQCLSLAYVSYIILLLPTFRFIFMTIWYSAPSIFNAIPCQTIGIANAAMWFTTQTFIHLFIAMRSRLNPSTITSHQNTTIYYNIGLMLIFSEFLFMFYTLSNTTFELGNASICQSANASLLRIIGTLWSSVVIGLYCLCGFIYPLRKYLKTGRTYGANDALVRYLLLKIIIYTIIMISTTIISASIFVISNDSIPTELVTAINYVINSYCMILQFKDLDIKHIQSQSIQSIVSCLQCSCCCIQQIQIKVQKEVDLADIMTIKRESPDTSGSGSQETSRACSETTPSDFHEDRRKYIETIIQGDIDNGVTGKYLSLSVVETAYIFWKKYIETAPKETQTELACCIYFEMMGMNDGMAELLKERVEKKQCTIKTFSGQLVSYLGWLINHLLAHDLDLYETLKKLGTAHKKMGIQIIHFGYLLAAVHTSFAQYFEHKYSIKEKHAMDKIFSVTSKIMYGKDINNVQEFIDFTESFDNLDFIKSLDVCLKSQVGCDYLHRYLQQTFCDEIVIWLESLKLFKLAMSDKERFMIARRLKTDCIDPHAPFAVNISHETRKQMLDTMNELESKWLTHRKSLTVAVDLFARCEMEMMRLIQKNHWKKFVEVIRTFANTSQ
eukprot:200253_1